MGGNGKSKVWVRNTPKACFAFLKGLWGAVGTKRLRNVIRRFSFLSPILTAKRPAVILLRKNRWNLRPAKESESFIRVRGRQVRLRRPVQVRSLRSVRITAILLCKSRANLLQSCSLAGGSRSRNRPANGRRPGRVNLEWTKSSAGFGTGDGYQFQPRIPI